MDDVIAKAMAKEADDRYATGAELAEAAAATFPEPKRPRWQIAALVGVLALLIAAAIAVPSILLTRGSGEAEPQGTTEITTNSVQRIHPETGELAAAIELDTVPEALAAGDAGVWLLNQTDRTLSLIDPETNSVTENVPLEIESTRLPERLEVREGLVSMSFTRQIPPRFDRSVWTYDPATGSLDQVALIESLATSSEEGEFAVDSAELWLPEFDSSARLSALAAS